MASHSVHEASTPASSRPLAPGANADGVGVSGADGSGVMFDAIAHRYDRLNRILSMGLDGGWRRRAVRAMNLGGGARVLDLATGTADLALEVVRQQPQARVVALDPSAGMLAEGQRKVALAGLEQRVKLDLGSAETLDLDADSFDAVGIAFGIRNVVDRHSALREMARVTRPGGRVVILELSEPRGLLGAGARFYLHQVVPRVGALLSGHREYRYLQRSIAAFPPPPVFTQHMAAAGLTVLSADALTFGVCHLFVATPAAESSSSPAPAEDRSGSQSSLGTQRSAVR